MFGQVSFANSQFTGHAAFAGAKFTGHAAFAGTQFTEGAVFTGAQFAKDAAFAGAQFTGHAVFTGAQFAKDAAFAGTQFTGHAVFEGAQFTEDAAFAGTQFTEDAAFAGAQFTGHAVFEGAQFTKNAVFADAQFTGHADFAGAQFTKDAVFTSAQFPKAESLGPLTARTLMLDGAVFDRSLVIEAAAAWVSCRSTVWKAGVILRLRYAAVILERATLTQPSFVTGSDRPFQARPFRELDDRQVRERILTERAVSSETWLPRLETLGGADAANLSVTDVDLSYCRFARTLLLDQLRLEGRFVFDHPPRGIYAGVAWPPVWRWSRRQSLAEERLWRTATRKHKGWWDSRAEELDELGPEVDIGPERLAALYRQLRKAQEDAKNEPGAADFYYGEMEMRRHSQSTPWAERLILAAYWAVCGYGLRATRAFVALALLIAGSAAVLQHAGFPGHIPTYLDSLLYAAGSVLSLNPVIGHLPTVLTHWGDVIRILLRIAGPVLLGLAALALRGRVKR